MNNLIPVQFTDYSGKNIPAPEITLYAETPCDLNEGPFCARNENTLYWVDPRFDLHPETANCLFRKTGPGADEFETFDPGIGSVSAFSQTPDGTFLLFASHCRVWLWKPGKNAELFAQLPGDRFKFNDVTTTPDGHVFCTVLPRDRYNGAGELFDLSPDGTFRFLDACRGIPNGMGFSPDHTRFYFTATTEKIIYCYRYHDGDICGKTVFAGGIGCDGLAVDTEGGIWSAGWKEKIRRFTPDGKVALELQFPGMIVSSLCFSGESGRDICITTGASPNADLPLSDKNSSAVLLWKNSPFQGIPIPLFGSR